MSVTQTQLIAEAKDNPWRLFTHAELGSILGISDKAVGAMKKAGAPFVFNKSTPQLLVDWIASKEAKNVEKM